MYIIKKPNGEVLADNISLKELRDITKNTSIIIDIFDQETDEFLGEFNPKEDRE